MSSINSVTGSTLNQLENYFNDNKTSYQYTMDQLSTGTKYTSMKDNPFEVAKSVKLSVQINTNTRASSNVAIGQDVLSLAADSETSVVDNISRIHDLCVQISNGPYSSTDKDAILQEIKSRLSYIDTVSSTTQFNGMNLLDGSSSSMTLQVGSKATNILNVGDALMDVSTTALDINLDSVTSADTWTTTDINTYMDKLDAASNELINSSSKIGAYQNRLSTISESLTSMNTDLTQKKSDIMDVDVASATSDLVKYQILQEYSVNILTQANNISSLALNLLNK